MRNIFANFILSIFPSTRAFRLKRMLLVMLGYKIGLDAKITGNVRFYGRGQILIGERTWIGIGCTFFCSENSIIEIGSDCDIAPLCVFHNGTHHVSGQSRRAGLGYSKDIHIGNGVWIGLGCKLLAGCNLGASSIVASGSVLVDKKYSSSKLIAGVPASEKRNIIND